MSSLLCGNTNRFNDHETQRRCYASYYCCSDLCNVRNCFEICSSRDMFVLHVAAHFHVLYLKHHKNSSEVNRFVRYSRHISRILCTRSASFLAHELLYVNILICAKCDQIITHLYGIWKSEITIVIVWRCTARCLIA